MATWFSEKLAGIAILAVLAGLCTCRAQSTWCVDGVNGSDGNGGTSWADAKKTIQAAIDLAAAPNDTVLVTNGTYDTGGKNGYPDGGLLTNRVVIDRAITVRAVGARDQTIINGKAAPSTTNGTSAIRGVYMVPGAVLDNFTVQDGHTYHTGGGTYDRSGGGVCCTSTVGIITNCVITNCSAEYGGGVYRGTLYGCSVALNWAGLNGGGVQSSVAYDCTISNNQALYHEDDVDYGFGGGASSATIVGGSVVRNKAGCLGGGIQGGSAVNCLISGNSTSGRYGGGAYSAKLVDCVLSYNTVDCTLSSATEDYGGGGARGGSLLRCTVAYNFVDNPLAGGGLNSCDATNCLIIGNSNLYYGCAAAHSTLVNCTVVKNVGTVGGPSAHLHGAIYCADDDDSSATNCIVYNNTGPVWPSIYGPGSMDYCCTTTNASAYGTGNITNSPAFADAAGSDYRLSTASPCINTGINQPWMDNATDFDGQQRIDHFSHKVDMGAYEFLPSGSIFVVR